MGMGKQLRSGSDSSEVIQPESLRGPGACKGTEIGSASAPEFGEANRQKPRSNSVNGKPGNAASICSPDREPLFQIVSRHDFSDVTYLLEVRHPLLARASKPGQFVIVQSHEHGERIPLTIADFDHQKGTITLVIQAVGKTTKEMQRICLEGARLFALVGPMGQPTRIGKETKVVCVGGGLGVAPVFPQLRAFKENEIERVGAHAWRGRLSAPP
jgi:hypothetical protein